MELTARQLDILRACAAYVGLDRDNVTTDYSGRGMYGQRCVGLAIPQREGLGILMRFGVALATATHEDNFAEEMAEEPVSTDSLGLGTIIYWPAVRYEGTPIDPFVPLADA